VATHGHDPAGQTDGTIPAQLLLCTIPEADEEILGQILGLEPTSIRIDACLSQLLKFL
jgi:hypothetical protein